MKKVLIRLELQGDPDLKILPIYFQQLKNYTKMRKLWKYVIKTIEIQVGRLKAKSLLGKRF